MVQILVHVRPADKAGKRHFELLECTPESQICSIKQQITQLGAASDAYELAQTEQELVFMGERCEDDKALKDYGICEPFVKQVTGFVVNPEVPGRRFVKGVLVAIPATA
ncbi:hypothetical protein WJX72_003146 [[Myrmecia] bisecta]|uniref:Ubiquitin-like domain-containing protein n=1 Tax=[Myrmecia] bisecta TaxID=41462 RepID=A0AAW1R5Q5_9CHLO